MRLLGGELRQGALEGVMVQALARAAEAQPAAVQRAFMLRGDLAAVAEAVLADGPPALERFRLEVGRPVRPMLARPAKDVEEAMERLGEAAIEWKLDGARVQIHRRDDDVRVFTRTLDDVTARVPEIVEATLALPVRVGRARRRGDRAATGRPAGAVPGHELALRARAGSARCRSNLFVFDVLHADGEDVLDRPAAERAALLAELVPEAQRTPRGRRVGRGRGGRVPRRRDRARPRGRDAEGARPAVRRRQPRHRLAEGQAGAHARPGRARGRVGPRPPARLAQQPAPRCARPVRRRLRDARQDVQGPHRRDAHVADGEAARSWRPRATTTRCTCGPSWSSRSPSTACRRARAIPAGSRCASRACCATGRTSRPPRRTRSTPCCAARLGCRRPPSSVRRRPSGVSSIGAVGDATRSRRLAEDLSSGSRMPVPLGREPSRRRALARLVAHAELRRARAAALAGTAAVRHRRRPLLPATAPRDLM